MKHGVIDVDIHYALPFNAGETIVELGGGDTPTKVEGLKVVNVDKRQLPTVDIVRDLDKGFSDIGVFDGLLANYLLEHICWRSVERFLADCYAIVKPGVHAVFLTADTYAQAQKITGKKPEDVNFDDSHMLFGVQEHEGDYHKWFISRPFIEKLLLKAGFTTVTFTDHPDPKARDFFVDAYKGEEKRVDKVMLNLGSFTVTHPKPWINCDIRGDIKQVVEDKGHIFEFCDVTKPLRWKEGEVDVITAYHLIEHLSREEGTTTLKECFRMLKPGGVMRLSTPDLGTFIKHIQDMDFKEKYAKEYEVQHSEDYTDAFFRLAFSGHKTIYNSHTLEKKLSDIGFIEVCIMERGKSRSKEIERDAIELFADHSFFIEAIKPTRPQPANVNKPERTPTITTREQLQPYQRYLRGEIEEGEQ